MSTISGGREGGEGREKKGSGVKGREGEGKEGKGKGRKGRGGEPQNCNCPVWFCIPVKHLSCILRSRS